MNIIKTKKQLVNKLMSICYNLYVLLDKKKISCQKNYLNIKIIFKYFRIYKSHKYNEIHNY